MSVVASCGHKLTEEESMGKTICVKFFDESGEKALCYTTLCDRCVILYRMRGLELKTQKEQDEWLRLK